MKTSRQTLQQGLTIVELMVAMAIAIILILGATGILITNQQAFRTTEGLSGIQDSSRVAVDMLARDLREAGGRPCVMSLSADYTGGDSLAAGFVTQLQQFAGLDVTSNDDPGNRNTEEGALKMVTVTDNRIVTAQAGTSLTVADSQLAAGDIIIACTDKAAYLLKVAAANAASITVVGVPPTADLTGATIATGLNSRLWYIGTNADGRLNSLYRRINSERRVEMVDNVVGLNAAYIGGGAVRIQLTVCSRLREQDLPPAPAGEEVAITEAKELCDPDQRRVTRTVTTIVQRRTA